MEEVAESDDFYRVPYPCPPDSSDSRSFRTGTNKEKILFVPVRNEQLSVEMSDTGYRTM